MPESCLAQSCCCPPCANNGNCCGLTNNLSWAIDNLSGCGCGTGSSGTATNVGADSWFLSFTLCGNAFNATIGCSFGNWGFGGSSAADNFVTTSPVNCADCPGVAVEFNVTIVSGGPLSGCSFRLTATL